MPEMAPKTIICKGSVLFMANPESTQNKNPDNDPRMDLFQTFPIGKARPTNAATASPTDKNNKDRKSVV